MQFCAGGKWLERAAVLAIASFFLAGCAGGGDSGADPMSVDEASNSPSPSGNPSSSGDSSSGDSSSGDSSSGDSPSSTTPDTPGIDSSPGTADNHAPTLSGTPATMVVIDAEYSFQFTASDADGDTLTVAVQNLPTWAQFDAGSRRLSGTPSAADAGTYANIVISASDGNSTTRMPAFSIQVVPSAMGQVTVSWLAPSTNTDGSTLTDLAGYKIYYGNSADNLNRSVQVDNAGLSSFVIDNLSPATYFFAITALNTAGTESARSPTVNKTL